MSRKLKRGYNFPKPKWCKLPVLLIYKCIIQCAKRGWNQLILCNFYWKNKNAKRHESVSYVQLTRSVTLIFLSVVVVFPVTQQTWGNRSVQTAACSEKGVDTEGGHRALSFLSWFVFCLCLQPESDWLAARAQYWLLWGCNRGWGDGIQDMNALTVACAAEL